MALLNFTRSRKFKNFMAKLYGFGAAVVIIGALFKINHYPYANEMLIIGLGTEAIIFFFSAFEPPHVEPDWSLVYPELEFLYHGGGAGNRSERNSKKVMQGLSSTQQLDMMLENAKIDNNLIESLGKGIKNLSQNADKIADISSACIVTDEYRLNMTKASESVTSLSNNIAKASESTVAFAESYSKTANNIIKSASGFELEKLNNKDYNEQLERIAKNLATLNGAYEMQIKNSDLHLKANDALNETLNNYLSDLSQAANDMKKYKQEVDELTKKVAALNNVYGNMLAAMNPNVK